ncbi:alanine/ornithine racemase family PLP-dependent enzyme [Fervidobacterium thailandense]|uniref:alanine/ornithine racemase family PLP-dependent enzyme n=1 Tax=Fervidobacterium thailandense TaxID=1008305 RepID=UPI000AF0E739|nr:alanine/ornithine racemase family PLP-dependent enzyme [Fervidobacterium thailandense]
MYPKLVIDLEAIASNTEKVAQMCHQRGIELVAVTKLVLADSTIAKTMRFSGADKLGDSRMKNIVKLREGGVPGPYQLLRIPMKSELGLVVRFVDEVLVSMPETAYELDALAGYYQRNLQVIYMVDVGDLREGVWFEKAVNEILDVARKLKNVRLVGIGTNVGCYGGVLPTVENMNILLNIKRELENQLDYELKVSGGSTVALKLLEDGTLPQGINQFRVGEGIILGTDATGDRDIPYLSQDTVVLEAEVVEVDYKPSVPYGELGKDAFGRTPVFEDRGWRRRVILAVGEQDVKPDGLKPLEKGLKVLHASSDHLIVDVTDSEREFKVGDIIRFRMSYGCALRAFTSPYVEKEFKRI